MGFVWSMKVKVTACGCFEGVDSQTDRYPLNSLRKETNRWVSRVRNIIKVMENGNIPTLRIITVPVAEIEQQQTKTAKDNIMIWVFLLFTY